jgi:hypothetical protein
MPFLHRFSLAYHALIFSERHNYYQLMDYSLIKADGSRVGESISHGVSLQGVARFMVFKYGRTSGFTTGEANEVTGIFRNRRFPNHRFAENVVLCKGLRDLLGPGDSGPAIIDNEPRSGFEDSVVALGFG